jgi:hypothetical protein
MRGPLERKQDSRKPLVQDVQEHTTGFRTREIYLVIMQFHLLEQRINTMRKKGKAIPVTARGGSNIF